MSDVLERARKWDAAVGVDEAVARAVAEERAAVVAWLRDCAHRDAYRNHNRNRAEALWDAANIVESGEHRREEEP